MLVTRAHALRAAFLFLERGWPIHKSDGVAVLLTDMQTVGQAQTNDPAMVGDWAIACDWTGFGAEAKLELALQTVFTFVDDFGRRWGYPDVVEFGAAVAATPNVAVQWSMAVEQAAE